MTLPLKPNEISISLISICNGYMRGLKDSEWQDLQYDQTGRKSLAWECVLPKQSLTAPPLSSFFFLSLQFPFLVLITSLVHTYLGSPVLLHLLCPPWWRCFGTKKSSMWLRWGTWLRLVLKFNCKAVLGTGNFTAVPCLEILDSGFVFKRKRLLSMNFDNWWENQSKFRIK